MTDLSISILVETLEDAIAIERLHERTFGPGRFVRTAQRIRERRQHILGLSFTAWVGRSAGVGSRGDCLTARSTKRVRPVTGWSFWWATRPIMRPAVLR